MNPVYLLLLPVLVSVGWVLYLLLLPRPRVRAHWLLGLSQLLEAFTLLGLVIYLTSAEGTLFIYDYIFELSAMFCIPVAYLGICSLTEPRGLSLAQRRVLLWPLLFVVGLTFGAFWLGPRRYDILCHLEFRGEHALQEGDAAWNFMMVWDRYIFWLMLIVGALVWVIMGMRKMHRFEQRYRNYYAVQLGEGRVRLGALTVVNTALSPLVLIGVAVLLHGGECSPVVLAAVTVLLVLMQWRKGYDIFRQQIDARLLAQVVRKQMEANV